MTALQRWIALFGAASFFFLLAALFWLLRTALRRRQRRLIERLVGQQADTRPGSRQAVLRLRGNGPRQRLQRRLHQAGIGVDPAAFLALCGGAALFVVLVGSLALESLLAGIVLALALLFGVRLHVNRRRDHRLQLMARQLPAALEMMAFSLRAGRGLEESMRVAAEETEPPLAHELDRCHHEYTLGRPVEEALQQLDLRWPQVRGVHLFVEAVAVLKQSGGNLVEVMGSIRDQLRAHQAHRAKHRAMTSEGRLSGSILLALPLLALVIQVVLMPGQLTEMLGESSGRMVLLVAVGLWAAGALWVSRLTRSVR